MKQKFIFTIDNAQGILKLAESAESDPGAFVTVHEEKYDLEEMKDAAQKGQSYFIEKMRRRNMFPPFDLAVKLFEAAKDMLGQDSPEGTVVEYEDIEGLPLSDHEAVTFSNLDDDDDDEIEDLLKEESDDLSEDDIKEIDSDDDTPRFLPDDDSEHEN